MNEKDKMKAALCHYFSFSIIFNNNKRIECIFINYEDYLKWYHRISIIVEDNKRHSKYNLFHNIFKQKKRTQSVDLKNERKLQFNMN